jgi:predicted GIY-YIG superfamily endonuclease
MWFVYILECENSDYYTGLTDNLERRFQQHRDGKGGHFTKYARPNKIAYFESHRSLGDAQARERQIKGWSRSKKSALIQRDFDKLNSLSSLRKK